MDWLNLNISFPITDPTWIFLLVLLIILFSPLLLNKLRIPHIIGMIIAGVIVGEHGLNILVRDSSFELFGNVGLYYIMFLAGLEMNLNDLKENRFKAMALGLLCFSIPIAIGFFINLSVLQYGVATSILLASMYASNTQVSYPIVLKYGLSHQRSVSIAVGGTAVTDTLTLLVLAVVSGSFKGDLSGSYWVWLVVKVIILSLIIIFLFPVVCRWFFRRYDDGVMQFIFVLAMAFLGAALMELVGMQGILGAFLAGLVLNRLIPRVSPLMNHIEFVGNALFIPYFLIGVGMLIDVHVIFGGGSALKVAGIMISVALAGKWIACFVVRKLNHMSRTEGYLMYGLSTAQAAATLAAVMVGYNIRLADGSRLLNDDVLNGTILLILVTCIVSSLITDKTARTIAKSEIQPDEHLKRSTERLLVTISNPDNITNLMELALMIRGTKFHDNLLSLNVVTDANNSDAYEKRGRQLLERAAMVTAAANVKLAQICRYDVNVTSGIIHTVKEQDVATVVLGLHRKTNMVDSFFGTITANLLKGIRREVIIAKILIPLNTIKRIVVAVPPNAEYEAGFQRWLRHFCRMGAAIGCRVHFYATEQTTGYIQSFLETKYKQTLTSFSRLDSWDDLLLLTGRVEYEHLFVVISARQGSISYDPSFEKLPTQLSRYFAGSSLIVLYPDQTADDDEPDLTFSNPHGDSGSQLYVRIGQWFYNWFRNKKQE